MSMGISSATARLFRAEVDNEAAGGVSPATLESALDSVNQGYDPRIHPKEEEWDADLVVSEIQVLIGEFGPAYPLESLEW